MRAHPISLPESALPESALPESALPGLDAGLEPDSPAGAPVLVAVTTTAAPANRAARRGRAKGQADQGADRTGSRGRPRAAQGRRVNPVRRTG